MANYCGECGAELTEGTKHCGECGAAVDTAPVAAPRQGVDLVKLGGGIQGLGCMGCAIPVLIIWIGFVLLVAYSCATTK